MSAVNRADGGRTALGRPLDAMVPCPSCNDGGFTFHKGVLDYVPCPTCRPDEHERRLRYGA